MNDPNAYCEYVDKGFYCVLLKGHKLPHEGYNDPDGDEFLMPTSKSAPSQYKRASEYSPNELGDSLDDILKIDVLLVGYDVGERKFKSDMRPFTTLLIAPLDDPSKFKMYHTWSESLAPRIAKIPLDALPVVIKFYEERTSGGFDVLTFE